MYIPPPLQSSVASAHHAHFFHTARQAFPAGWWLYSPKDNKNSFNFEAAKWRLCPRPVGRASPRKTSPGTFRKDRPFTPERPTGPPVPGQVPPMLKICFSSSLIVRQNEETARLNPWGRIYKTVIIDEFRRRQVHIVWLTSTHCLGQPFILNQDYSYQMFSLLQHLGKTFHVCHIIGEFRGH